VRAPAHQASGTLPSSTAHPGTGRQADGQEGGGLAGGEQADLERARLQRDHRDQRQRQLADLGAELADGVGNEQLAEVEVPQQAESLTHEGSLRYRLGKVNQLFFPAFPR
jgi:hypothetical protein